MTLCQRFTPGLGLRLGMERSSSVPTGPLTVYLAPDGQSVYLAPDGLNVYAAP